VSGGHGFMSIFSGPALLWILLILLFGGAWVFWHRKWYVTSVLLGAGAMIVFMIFGKVYIA
jgi:hypothetical protein